MAKKVKEKYNSPLATAPGEYKPRLYLDLEGKSVKELEGLKVGDVQEFCVRGKIVGLEERTRTDEKGKERVTGSIQLEGYEVESMEEESNEFDELSD